MNEMTPMQTTDITEANVEQTKAIAITGAQFVAATQRPRDEQLAQIELNKACKRERFAEIAQYPVIRGGAVVGKGASIHMAQEIARLWGNIYSGWAESRKTGYSEISVYAIDLQTNTTNTRTITVPHVRYTRRGEMPLTSQDDIAQMVANYAQRTRRSVLLSLIPKDIVDAACDQADHTMLQSIGGDLRGATEKTIKGFEQIGVTRDMLCSYLQTSQPVFQAEQILGLRRIYASIRDGYNSPADYFRGASTQANKMIEQKPSVGDVVKGRMRAFNGAAIPDEPLPPGEIKPLPTDEEMQSEFAGRLAGEAIEERYQQADQSISDQEVPDEETQQAQADRKPKIPFGPGRPLKAQAQGGQESMEANEGAKKAPVPIRGRKTESGIPISKLLNAFGKRNVTEEMLVEWVGMPLEDCNEGNVEALRELNNDLRDGRKTVEEVWAAGKLEEEPPTPVQKPAGDGFPGEPIGGREPAPPLPPEVEHVDTGTQTADDPWASMSAAAPDPGEVADYEKQLAEENAKADDIDTKVKQARANIRAVKTTLELAGIERMMTRELGGIVPKETMDALFNEVDDRAQELSSAAVNGQA